MSREGTLSQLHSKIEFLTRDELKEVGIITNALVSIREASAKRGELEQEIVTLEKHRKNLGFGFEKVKIPKETSELFKGIMENEGAVSYKHFNIDTQFNLECVVTFVKEAMYPSVTKEFMDSHFNEFSIAFLTGDWEVIPEPELPRKFYQNPFTRKYLGYDTVDGQFFDADAATVRRYEGNENIIFNFYGNEELIGTRAGYEVVGEVKDIEF